MKVYEEFIRAHLPKELADRPIIGFDYYFLDGLNIMTDDERGGDDILVYKAKSEEDLMLWQYSQVCKFIGDWPEFEKRMGYPKKWLYYRAYAKNNKWKYIEYTKYDYNAIEDSRLKGFEKYLALIKYGFPPERWEKEVKGYIALMNYWYSKPHWDYDREKLCFIEISDSKEHDEHSNPIDEPQPGSVIKVIEGYYSYNKDSEIQEETQESDSQGSSNNIDKDKIEKDNLTVFHDNTYKLLKSGTNYYLCKGNESYKLTCHPYEPCTYIEGRCIHNAFEITYVFESFLDNEKITSISGREYGPKEFCDLLYAMIENNLDNVNIDYVEKMLWGNKKTIEDNKQKYIEEDDDDDDDEIDEEALETDFGYKLEGTLRERIIKMMEIAGDNENNRWKISTIKDSYKRAKVNLYPTAEKFISRYAYLFSAMSPTFKYEIDCTRFFFDCYDSIDETTNQVELLRKATFDTALPDTGYNFSKIFLKVKEKALCNVTAVGRFGYFPASTLYIGENGKLYATKDNINDIRVYDNVVDLLEYELKDHIPMGITD